MSGALKELSGALATLTGKPESYIVVHIVPDQETLSFYAQQDHWEKILLIFYAYYNYYWLRHYRIVIFGSINNPITNHYPKLSHRNYHTTELL